MHRHFDNFYNLQWTLVVASNEGQGSLLDPSYIITQRMLSAEWIFYEYQLTTFRRAHITMGPIIIIWTNNWHQEWIKIHINNLGHESPWHIRNEKLVRVIEAKDTGGKGTFTTTSMLDLQYKKTWNNDMHFFHIILHWLPKTVIV